jgi:hypothetical protein
VTSRPRNELEEAPEQDRYQFDRADICRDRAHRGAFGLRVLCLDCLDARDNPPDDGPFVDVSGGAETADGRMLRTWTCEHGFLRLRCRLPGHRYQEEDYEVYHGVTPEQRVRGPLAARLVELDRLTTRKNEGYAGAAPADPWANYNSAPAWGRTGLDSVLLRFEEKRNRASVLYSGRGADRVGEGLRETLLDAAAIALIAVDMLSKKEAEL